jgi:hypothetical protein
LGDAERGTGQFAKVLQGAGIELRNQDGSLRSVSALFDEYAARIANASTEQEALSLAVAGFGRSGAAFVTTIREMRAGLDKFDVLTKEQIATLGKYDDKITEVAATFELEFKKRLVTTIEEIERLGAVLDRVFGTSFAEAVPRTEILTRQLDALDNQLRATGSGSSCRFCACWKCSRARLSPPPSAMPWRAA